MLCVAIDRRCPLQADCCVIELGSAKRLEADVGEREMFQVSNPTGAPTPRPQAQSPSTLLFWPYCPTQAGMDCVPEISVLKRKTLSSAKMIKRLRRCAYSTFIMFFFCSRVFYLFDCFDGMSGVRALASGLGCVPRA